ncbi:MAG: glycosyltransferase family 4 protein [Myxococcota bacterium]
MIALEVSSAAGRHAYGGIPRAIRCLVGALLEIDPETRYDLCYRFSRWRRGNLYRPNATNVRVRMIQDPFNTLLMSGNRLFHSMGIYVPKTPQIPKLVTVNDLNAVRNVQWVTPHWHERRSARIREAVRRADHIVAISRFAAQEIREEFGLPEDRVHPVLLGVDQRLFTPPGPEAIERVRARYGDYVLAIGVLTPRKNFVRLVQAMAPLKDLRLVLVGHGSSDGRQEVEQAIERCGLGDRVTRLEGISDREIVELMGASRVYAVPSLYEGFGLTVLEAMACGAPVVCSRAASLPEVAGDAAWSVDATSVEELSDAFRRVSEDTALAEQLRARGLERARRFSWESAARTLRTLYRTLGA